MSPKAEIAAKTIPALVVILAIFLLGKFVYHKIQDYSEIQRKYQDLVHTKDAYEQLTKYVGKLESDYQNQKDLAAKANAKWVEVVRQKDERIQQLSDVTFTLAKFSEKQNGMDYTFYTPKKTQNFSVSELSLQGPDSPPVGMLMIKSDGTVYKTAYPFHVEVETLQLKDSKTGKVRLFSKAFYVSEQKSSLEKRIKGYHQWQFEKYPLPITSGTVEVDPTETGADRPRFFLLAPKLNAGINAGVEGTEFALKPGINVSLSGYGRAKSDLDWKFLQMGTSVDSKMKDPSLDFIPFTYRPFPRILDNTYLGPGYGLSGRGGFYFLHLGINF